MANQMPSFCHHSATVKPLEAPKCQAIATAVLPWSHWTHCRRVASQHDLLALLQMDRGVHVAIVGYAGAHGGDRDVHGDANSFAVQNIIIQIPAQRQTSALTDAMKVAV